MVHQALWSSLVVLMPLLRLLLYGTPGHLIAHIPMAVSSIKIHIPIVPISPCPFEKVLKPENVAEMKAWTLRRMTNPYLGHLPGIRSRQVRPGRVYGGV